MKEIFLRVKLEEKESRLNGMARLQKAILEKANFMDSVLRLLKVEKFRGANGNLVNSKAIDLRLPKNNKEGIEPLLTFEIKMDYEPRFCN
jgi:hypothetical protein